ncbi:MAG: SUMF1/EgtB/PvdO family nonheme iron enzyme [Bacteroidales bacterium]
MNYPLISDYISSLEFAEDNLAELSHLRPVLDSSGHPIMSSGNFAVVFKMEDDDGGLYAIKCFLKDVPHRMESYRMISEELEYVNSSFLTTVRYIDDEIYVDSNNTSEDEFPIVLMDWIEGVTLDAYVRSNLHDKESLSVLCYQFGRLASWLLSQPFAHGDLKPDNILVRPDGTLCLVDYDGMYVSAMKGSSSPEMGTPDYRHPMRSVDQFNEHIDDFSLATIALSLKAISLDPSLLSSTGASEGLLLFDRDYRDLGSSSMLQKITTLYSDKELITLYALFLIAQARQELTSISHRLFLLDRPAVKSGKRAVRARNALSTSENLTFTVGGVSFDMVHVEGGSFFMGATPEQGDDAYEDEKPVHKVTLSSYSIGKHQVTQALWVAVMGSNPSRNKQGGSYPVESVSWNHCQEFINKLNSITGKKFALPTEAQWEFAARGGVKSQGFKFAGSNNLDEVAWYSVNTGDKIHPVGEKKANELGIYDMSGNVWEWCSDRFADYSSSDQTDPTGSTSGYNRVIRGGSCWDGAGGCRSSCRGYGGPSYCDDDYGLRLAFLP